MTPINCGENSSTVCRYLWNNSSWNNWTYRTRCLGGPGSDPDTTAVKKFCLFIFSIITQVNYSILESVERCEQTKIGCGQGRTFASRALGRFEESCPGFEFLLPIACDFFKASWGSFRDARALEATMVSVRDPETFNAS